MILFPYNETLVCNGNDCLVTKKYLLRTSEYKFDKNDSLKSNYKSSCGRSNCEYRYYIFNETKNGYVFDNTLDNNYEAENIIKIIKSGDFKQIKKNWLNCKIEQQVWHTCLTR